MTEERNGRDESDCHTNTMETDYRERRLVWAVSARLFIAPALYKGNFHTCVALENFLYRRDLQKF